MLNWKYLSILVFFKLLFDNEASEYNSFHGYKLLKLIPKTRNHVELLDMWEDNKDFDVWNRIKGINHSIDVLLSPNAFQKYSPLFDSHNILFEIIDHNIQNKINEQKRSMELSKKSFRNNIVGKYARYNEIINYIDNIVSDNPNLASSYIAGNTYENRQLKVLVLKTNLSKKSIWLDCGIHAREWISPATCIWFIDSLLRNFTSGEATAVELLNYYEFHILPVVNPDGYEYTFNTYRLWRKNRRPNSNSSCYGTDINRNFDYEWMTSGASLEPCADTYAGPKPGSELETQAVKNAINAKLNNWDSFITLHSYGAFWMMPWGYTTNKPEDYNDLYQVSKIGADALREVYGQIYSIGSPSSLINSAAGGSFDWTKAVAGIKYSICLELRPGQTGPDSQYGFTLPESRVPTVGRETYVGLIAMIKAIKGKLSK